MFCNWYVTYIRVRACVYLVQPNVNLYLRKSSSSHQHKCQNKTAWFLRLSRLYVQLYVLFKWRKLRRTLRENHLVCGPSFDSPQPLIARTLPLPFLASQGSCVYYRGALQLLALTLKLKWNKLLDTSDKKPGHSIIIRIKFKRQLKYKYSNVITQYK